MRLAGKAWRLCVSNPAWYHTIASFADKMDLAALCVASTEGDAKAVRELLIANSACSLPAAQAPTGPDDPLHPSPAECRSLHDALFGPVGESRDVGDSGDGSGGVDEETIAGTKRKRPSSHADEAKWGENTAAAVVAESSPSHMQLPSKEEDIVALIRALLMIPGTAYATPWEAAVCAVSAVQTRSGVFGQQQSDEAVQAHVEGKMTMAEAVVAEIGIFLGTVGHYPRRRTIEKVDRSNGDAADRDERTQRALLRRLANLIVAPLILERCDGDGDDDAGQGESAKGKETSRSGIAAALGLLPALVGAAKRMDRGSTGRMVAASDLVSSILDRLVPSESSCTVNSSNDGISCSDENSKKGVKATMVALLLPTLVSLGPHISQQRWLDARALITRVLADVPSADLPALATILVDQVISSKSSEKQMPIDAKTNGSDEAASSTAAAKSSTSSWCKLLLRLYQHAADADSSTFGAASQATNTATTSSILSAIELALSKRFAAIPSTNLIWLVDAIKDVATRSDEADTRTPQWVASNIILLIGATSGPNERSTERIMVDRAILGSTSVSSSGRRRRRGSTPVSSYALDILLEFAEVESMLHGENQQERRLTLPDLRNHFTRPKTKQNHEPCEKVIQRLAVFIAQAIFLGGRLCCESGGNCMYDVIKAHVRRYLDFASEILAQFDSDASTLLAEHEVILRLGFALAVYTVVFEGVPGLRQDILLNLTRELCSDDSGGSTHYDLALLALCSKAQEQNEREVADEESVDIDAAVGVSEFFDALVDVLDGRRTIGKDSEDACRNLEPLSTHVIRTVAQVLCPVSSKGRRTVSNVATRLISSLTKSTDELPPHLVSVARIPDSAPLVIDLLCLLLRPTGSFARDSYFSSSLAKLCNMMVLDAPPLGLAARQALYSHLSGLAKEGELDAWTCTRLERAAICALLKYFGSISEPSGGPDDRNDICTMRLSFLPERSFTPWSRFDEESRRRAFHVTQVDDISMLLELILALRAARLGDHRSLSKSLVKVIGEGSSPDILDCSATTVGPSTHGSGSEEVGNLIDQVLSHCLGVVAQSIFSSESTVDRSDGECDRSDGECVWKSCRLLRKRISSEETAILEVSETERATTRTATKEPLFPPMWLEYDESQAFQATNVDHEIVLDSIVPSLCSTIFNIVLGGGSPNADDTEHALSLAIAFNQIIQKTSAVREQNEEAASVLIDDLSTNLIEHAHPYLEASTLALRQLLTAKFTNDSSSTNEMRLYVVLKGLERCCHCIENIVSYNLPQDFDIKQMAASLWKIYLEVGGENGACRLIRHLDECLMRAKGAGVPDLAIESHEDIDELVRSVRISVLTSLASLVKYSHPRLGLNNPRISLDELLGNISSLCSDLYTGLDGKSGGITRNVFMAYLTAIDTCVASILSMDHKLILQEFSSGATDLVRAQALIEASSILLWNIPCKFCLDQEARTFKTTLDMALSGLQSVRRHIDFVLLYVEETSIASSNTNVSGPRNACCSLSHASVQCVGALRKGSVTSKGRKKSSRKVIDDDSSSDDSSSSSNDDASSDEYESDQNIGGTLKTSGDSATSEKSLPVLPNALRRLQVNTSNAWTWTQTAVFLAVETNWAESQSIIKAKNLNVRGHSSQMLAAYVARRHQDLSLALNSATSFLETAQHTALSSNHGSEDGLSPNRQGGSDDEEHKFDDKEEQINDTLLSEMLSSTTKLKLAATLDRVTTTLRAALRVMPMMLKDGKDEGRTESAPNLQKSIQFCESVACICAWFTCSRNGQAIMTSGARRWFHNEKAHYRVAKAKAKAGGYHLDQDPILSRLPKVLYQMEELEVSFQKLAAIISAPPKPKKKNSKICQTFLANVDALLPSSTTSTKSTSSTLPSDEIPKSFAAIVAEHRDNLASSSDSKLSSFDMALISFKDKDDELGNPTLGKRKRRGRTTAIENHLRKAQRNVLRSRNEVVDEWLDLDADNADRNDSMDAFVDLEDFLVEG